MQCIFYNLKDYSREANETERKEIFEEQLEPKSGHRWPLEAGPAFAVAVALAREKRDAARPRRRRG